MLIAILAGLVAFIVVAVFPWVVYVIVAPDFEGPTKESPVDREYLLNCWADAAHELVVMTRRHDAIAKQAFAMRRLVQRNNERNREANEIINNLILDNVRLTRENANLKASLQGMFDWSNAQQRKAAT